MRFLPTEAEVKLLRQYERDRKPLEALSDEDRFMMQFSRIERLNQRMSIMTFMGNFTDNVQMLTPVRQTNGQTDGEKDRQRDRQTNKYDLSHCDCVSFQQLHAMIAASVSIKSSQKLKKILEVRLCSCLFL